MKSVPQKKPAGLTQAIQIDPGQVKSHVDELVRGTVEETLSSLLDAQADRLYLAGFVRRSTPLPETDRVGSIIQVESSPR